MAGGCWLEAGGWVAGGVEGWVAGGWWLEGWVAGGVGGWRGGWLEGWVAGGCWLEAGGWVAGEMEGWVAGGWWLEGGWLERWVVAGGEVGGWRGWWLEWRLQGGWVGGWSGRVWVAVEVGGWRLVAGAVAGGLGAGQVAGTALPYRTGPCRAVPNRTVPKASNTMQYIPQHTAVKQYRTVPILNSHGFSKAKAPTVNPKP